MNILDVQQAIQAFWSSFGIPAYDEDTVPDKTAYPYITYETVSDFMGSTVVVSPSIWYRSTSWADVTAKEMEIAEAIGRGGKMVECDGGGFWIKRGVPWAVRLTEPSDLMVRRISLNCEIDFIV